jgi:hypothetical protein
MRAIIRRLLLALWNITERSSRTLNQKDWEELDEQRIANECRLVVIEATIIAMEEHNRQRREWVAREQARRDAAQRPYDQENDR